jgi:hypothetical protein
MGIAPAFIIINLMLLTRHPTGREALKKPNCSSLQ